LPRVIDCKPRDFSPFGGFLVRRRAGWPTCT